jgi:hypothetical protein
VFVDVEADVDQHQHVGILVILVIVVIMAQITNPKVVGAKKVQTRFPDPLSPEKEGVRESWEASMFLRFFCS